MLYLLTSKELLKINSKLCLGGCARTYSRVEAEISYFIKKIQVNFKICSTVYPRNQLMISNLRNFSRGYFEIFLYISKNLEGSLGFFLEKLQKIEEFLSPVYASAYT